MREVHHGQCHCGGIRFTVRLRDGLASAVRCNCTMCRMKGAVMAFASLEDLALTQGAELLGTYQFHTGAAKHHFCTRCGIHTHHQRRFDPTVYAVNTATLAGVTPFDFAEVPVVDGQNHPLDHGGGPMRVVGHIRYQPASD